MHQQPRGPARVSSPAGTPQPGVPSRSNSTREAALGSRPRAGSNVAGRDAPNSPNIENPPTPAPPAESVKKLDQIIQVWMSWVGMHWPSFEVLISSQSLEFLRKDSRACPRLSH